MGNSYLDADQQERRKCMQKRGNIEEKKDAAHHLSHSILKAGMLGEKGRPLDAGSVVPPMNSSHNLHRKTQHGNRSTDKSHDNVIEENLRNQDTKISNKQTAKRCKHAHERAVYVAEEYAINKGRRSVQLDNVADRLGDMEYQNGRPGRDRKVRNLE